MSRRLFTSIALLSLVLVPATGGLAQDMAPDVGMGLVSATDHPTLGRILADADGLTLYTWAGDTQGTSNRSGGCATAWPPALVDEGNAMNLTDMSAGLGTVQRSDGTYQLAMDGWPLYRFSQDAQRGDAMGEGSNGFGARWSVVNADAMMMPDM